MAPTYNLGTCDDCCPACSAEVTLFFYDFFDDNLNDDGYLTLYFDGGIATRQGVGNIIGPGGQVSVSFSRDENAVYDGSVLTVSIIHNNVIRTFEFLSVNVTSSQQSSFKRWEYRSSTCREL